MIAIMDTFLDAPFVSISDDQRTHAAVHPRYAGTVYHGIPRNMFKFNQNPGTSAYLAWLGRLVADKAPDMAIRIAVKTGIRLKLAGNIVEQEKGYWLERVKPLIDQHTDLIEFIGEINDTQKE